MAAQQHVREWSATALAQRLDSGTLGACIPAAVVPLQTAAAALVVSSSVSCCCRRSCGQVPPRACCVTSACLSFTGVSRRLGGDSGGPGQGPMRQLGALWWTPGLRTAALGRPTRPPPFNVVTAASCSMPCHGTLCWLLWLMACCAASPPASLPACQHHQG